MIRDEAEKLCERLRERFGGEGSEFTAEVAASDERVEFAAPGGARPHIIRYKIRVTAGEQEALVSLEDCESALDASTGRNAEALFREIAARS
ncbi:MAG TPA: hypothetical protein VFW71_00690 [Actinomycetota bacterium]|nr:hypothetical protein [Actinomycetota bacterium]